MSTRVSKNLARALWTSSEVRGSATFLRRDVLEEVDLPVSPDTACFFRSAPWKVTRSHSYTESQHVNLQELEEIINEAQDLGMRGTAPTRAVNGTDSNVSLFASAKGRSG